jgi:hypothetical protein
VQKGLSSKFPYLYITTACLVRYSKWVGCLLYAFIRKQASAKNTTQEMQGSSSSFLKLWYLVLFLKHHGNSPHLAGSSLDLVKRRRHRTNICRYTLAQICIYTHSATATQFAGFITRMARSWCVLSSIVNDIFTAFGRYDIREVLPFDLLCACAEIIGGPQELRVAFLHSRHGLHIAPKRVDTLELAQLLSDYLPLIV